MPRPPDVIHDLVFAAFLKSVADSSGQVVQNCIPGNPLPLPFASLAHAPQRIENALRVIDLVNRRRTFGAVAATTARMCRIPFKFLDLHLVFVNISQQTASSLTVKTDGRDERIVLLDFLRPLRRIIFSPVVPPVRRRKAGKTTVRSIEFERSRIEGKLF